MTDDTKGWTPERREAQRQRALANKPWLNATGPRTKRGKARACGNALKHGMRAKVSILLRRALRMRDKLPIGSPRWVSLTKTANELNECVCMVRKFTASRANRRRKRTEGVSKRSEGSEG